MVTHSDGEMLPFVTENPAFRQNRQKNILRAGSRSAAIAWAEGVSHTARFLWKRALMQRQQSVGGLSAVVCLLTATLGGQEPGKVSPSGAIEGIVTYQADSARPWRYSRYYIKDPRQGQLAEAV